MVAREAAAKAGEERHGGMRRVFPVAFGIQEKQFKEKIRAGSFSESVK